jgi:hypothetical protein
LGAARALADLQPDGVEVCTKLHLAPQNQNRLIYPSLVLKFDPFAFVSDGRAHTELRRAACYVKMNGAATSARWAVFRTMSNSMCPLVNIYMCLVPLIADSLYYSCNREHD